MEVIYIALKDTYQSFKNLFMIVFAFGIPLMLGGFYFLVFGGASDGQDSFSIPQTNIAIVNLDEGYQYLNTPMGNLLFDTFNAESMPEGLAVTQIGAEQEARQALLDDTYDVVLVIPPSFSADLFDTESVADIAVLAIPGENATGVNIVKSITRQLVTGLESSFAVSSIAYEEAYQNNLNAPLTTTEEGFEPSAQAIQITMESVLPEEETESIRQTMMKPALGGMMIFFGFFTGCAVAAMILEEEKQNTLQRLFTAPFSRKKVINGKFLSTFLVLIIQIALLLLISWLLFGLRWGSFWLQAAFTLLTAAISASFGIFLLSFLKDPKSAGMIYSGINTAVGMIAISSTFAGRSDVLPFSLFTPHAWPLRMIYQMQNGYSPQILVTMGGILLWSIVFFTIGVWNFNRRYVKEA